LNDAVDKTTNKKNQISNENRNLELAVKGAEGNINKANREKYAILNESTATINKILADNAQQIKVDTDRIAKTKGYIDDFMG